MATAKLTSSLADQALLEDLLEAAKPPLPDAAEKRHWLISTPFRYPPLRYGSRFGRRHERAIFYGSRRRRTVLAEIAYYRYVFVAGSEADLLPLKSQFTLFQAEYQSRQGIDLTQPPFARYRELLAAADRYQASQTLGSRMREAGVAVFRYFSARRPGAVNIGIFTPRAIRSSQPIDAQTWTLLTEASAVTAFRDPHFAGAAHEFSYQGFLVDGELPQPAV